MLPFARALRALSLSFLLAIAGLAATALPVLADGGTPVFPR